MDRGIPTEETLAKMRESACALHADRSGHPVHYLVGTPKGRLSKLEKKFFDLPWSKARESVDVKLLKNEGDLYILARSTGRVKKERSMRMPIAFKLP